MDEDEKYNTKENGLTPDASLPDINKGKTGSQQFQMDDFNSKDSDHNDHKVFSPSATNHEGKNHSKRMSVITDKLNHIEEGNSHKNGTLTGSDHKPAAKSPAGTAQVNHYENNLDNSRSGVQNEREEEDKNEGSQAGNEILYKERKKCPKCPPRVTDFINKILDNHYYIIFMTIVTLYALFGDDLRLLFSPKKGDPIFWGFSVAAMSLFLLELVLASFAQKDYFLGFYFWLDLIATVSLITDIGWIYNEIVGGGDISANNASQASSLARAGRGARVGTRAGRIVRLVRLIRIVKLYKNAHKALEKNTPVEGEDITAEELQQIHEKNDEKEIEKESYVGQKLSDLTTRRVITIVLIMMFSVPILSLDTYIEEPTSFKWGLQLISSFDDTPGHPGYTTSFDTFISESGSTRNPVVSLNANGRTFDSTDPTLDDLRTIEVLVATIDGDRYVSVHDNRKNIRVSAGLGIGRTIFICLVLTIAAMFFSSTTNSLVINPIESMIKKVKKIAKNPLEAAQEEENQALAMERLKKNDENEDAKRKKKDKEGLYETDILENTIVKIGALLAIGFGEAGSAIIAKNMEKSGEVDPMLPGKK